MADIVRNMPKILDRINLDQNLLDVVLNSFRADCRIEFLPFLMEFRIQSKRRSINVGVITKEILKPFASPNFFAKQLFFLRAAVTLAPPSRRPKGPLRSLSSKQPLGLDSQPVPFRIGGLECLDELGGRFTLYKDGKTHELVCDFELLA